MKRAVIVALIVVNVGLAAALIAGAVAPAQAQTIRGANDFLMMTAKIEQNYDAVFVLDMQSRRLAAWQFDRTAKRMKPFKGRLLTTDFPRTK